MRIFFQYRVIYSYSNINFVQPAWPTLAIAAHVSMVPRVTAKQMTTRVFVLKAGRMKTVKVRNVMYLNY